MASELKTSDRAVAQRSVARSRVDYVRLLEALETCIRFKGTPDMIGTCLAAIDAFRK